MIFNHLESWQSEGHHIKAIQAYPELHITPLLENISLVIVGQLIDDLSDVHKEIANKNIKILADITSDVVNDPNNQKIYEPLLKYATGFVTTSEALQSILKRHTGKPCEVIATSVEGKAQKPKAAIKRNDVLNMLMYTLPTKKIRAFGNELRSTINTLTKKVPKYGFGL